METHQYEELVGLGTDNFLFPTADGKWMKIKSTRRVPSEPVRCIRVDNDSHLYAICTKNKHLLTHNTGGGKSVLERNVVFHCISHSKQIKFLGIDLKRVELSAYKKYTDAVLGIATTLEDAVEILRFAQETMMNRYAEMEEAGQNNFLDMENAGSALLVMIDEAGELLDTSAPAKALAASTYVPTMEARESLEQVQVGDHVIGEDGAWCEVTNKYEPDTQNRFQLDFDRDSDHESETFVAGDKHLWTVTVDGREVVMDSGELFDLYNRTPDSEKDLITFTRSKSAITD
jgi:hypothetical protein